MLWNVGEMKEYSAGWTGILSLSEAGEGRNNSLSSRLPYKNVVCLAVVLSATPHALHPEHSIPVPRLCLLCQWTAAQTATRSQVLCGGARDVLKDPRPLLPACLTVERVQQLP